MQHIKGILILNIQLNMNLEFQTFQTILNLLYFHLAVADLKLDLFFK